MATKAVYILLAGGKSSRMGVAKGLLKYRHTFWLLEQLERISKSNCTTIVLGLGHNYQQYFRAIPWLEAAQKTPVSFLNTQLNVVVNETPELGQFSTLQNCLKSLKEIANTHSILISPVDTPIDTEVYLNKIIAVDADVAQLNFEGKNGHPIKISKKLYDQLTDIDVNDKEARLDVQLKKTNPARCAVITTPNRDCIINFNTPSEWKEYLSYAKLGFQ